MCKLKQSMVVGRHSRATASVSTCWHARPSQGRCGAAPHCQGFIWMGRSSLTEDRKEEKRSNVLGVGEERRETRLVLDPTDLRHL